MKTSYFNTTHSTRGELCRYENQALSQEQKILRWFKRRHGHASPTDVLRDVFFNQVPITSVRRALTNLTNNGDMVKAHTQVEGPYGRPEHLWRLAPKYDQRELF